jgi:Predicted membrane protein (DUF2053)
MTLYHFANCLALAYTPYYLTYKYTGLAEYGAFWKVSPAVSGLRSKKIAASPYRLLHPR